MALKNVMGVTGKKAGDLGLNESIEGYLIGLAETKFNFALKLLTKEGKVETLYPNGNLNYIDQELEEGNITLNVYTKITRTGTRTSTKSRDQAGEFRQVPVFLVAQDADDVIAGADADSALASDKAESTLEDTSPKSGSKFANRAKR